MQPEDIPMNHLATFFKEIAIHDDRFKNDFKEGHYSQMRVVKVKKNSSTHLLFHPDHEIIFIVEGKAKIRAYGQTFNLKKYDMIHIIKGVVHQVINVGKNTLVLVSATHSMRMKKIKV